MLLSPQLLIDFSYKQSEWMTVVAINNEEHPNQDGPITVTLLPLAINVP